MLIEWLPNLEVNTASSGQIVKDCVGRIRRENTKFYLHFTKNIPGIWEMVVLLGKNLNPWKRVWYALQAYEGVGLFNARKLCDQALVHPLAKVKDLGEGHIVKLKSLLQPMLESQRQKKLMQIKASKSMPRPILPL